MLHVVFVGPTENKLSYCRICIIYLADSNRLIVSGERKGTGWSGRLCDAKPIPACVEIGFETAMMRKVIANSVSFRVFVFIVFTLYVYLVQ